MAHDKRKELIDLLLGGEKESSRCVIDQKELECDVYLLHIKNSNGDCYSVLKVNGLERFWVPVDEEKKLLKWWECEGLKRKGEEFTELGKEAIGGGWVLCKSAEIAKEIYLNFALSSIGHYAEAEYHKDMLFVVQQKTFDKEAAEAFKTSLAKVGIAGLFYFQLDDTTQTILTVKDTKVVFNGKEEDHSFFMDSGIGIGFFCFSSEMDYNMSKSGYDSIDKIYDDPIYKEFRKNLNINWNYPYATVTFGGSYNFSVLSNIIEEIACYVRTGELLVVDSEGHLLRFVFRDGDIETFDLPRPCRKD